MTWFWIGPDALSDHMNYLYNYPKSEVGVGGWGEVCLCMVIG